MLVRSDRGMRLLPCNGGHILVGVSISMIYTDGIHVISSTGIEALHEWAEERGIRRHFYHPGRHPHYDIPKRRRGEAFFAIRVSTRELIRILKCNSSHRIGTIARLM